jgi:hypothetical protein
MSSDWVNETFEEELYQLPSRAVIVLPQEWQSLADTEKELLKKILQAVRLSLETVRLIEAKTLTLSQLIALTPIAIIGFGSTLHGVPAYYEPAKIDSVICLQSHALGELDDSRKKQLWNALKGLFLP